MRKEVEGEVGRVGEGTSNTLGILIERWRELGGPAAASTRLVYAGYIKNQIKPYLWETRLDRLQVVDMDCWQYQLRKAGLKPASIRKAHTNALRHQAATTMIDAGIDPKPPPDPKRAFLSGGPTR